VIAVVDYHKGNLQSVARGLAYVGAEVCITDDASVLKKASAIVLPGVGAFKDAATSLENLGLSSVILDCVHAAVPFLGICIGMHLMFEEGDEGYNPASDAARPQGLGLFPGRVSALPRQDEAGKVYKIPHVGWNSIEPYAAETFQSPLLDGIDAGEFFYFTHSFAAPLSAATIAQTTHANTFSSAVQWKDWAFGLQFHPEKSSDAGMHVLKNFVSLV
jgi:glutamine amidotransferase